MRSPTAPRSPVSRRRPALRRWTGSWFRVAREGPDLHWDIRLVVKRVPGTVRRPDPGIPRHALAVSPGPHLLDHQARPLEQEPQPPGREPPVVEHAVFGELVDLDQEGRRDDHLSTRRTQPAQVGGRLPRIGDMLQHLLTDDHVEGAIAGEWCAEVELRIVETRVLLPRAPRVVVPADLGRGATGRIEGGEPAVRGAVHRDPLPLVGGSLGLRIEGAIPQAT